MSFSQMAEVLRMQNKEKIILIKLGVFYVAIGEDAVLLHNNLKLKCTCFKQNICKIGIPINSLEKYIEKIENLGYSYIVYNFKKEEGLQEIKEFKGKANKEKNRNINCLQCKGIERYKDDKYMEALRKYYEQKRR